MSNDQRRRSWAVMWSSLVLFAFASASAGVSAAGAGDQSAATTESGPSVLDGVFTAGQAGRGEQTFKQACTACHTVDKMTGNKFRAKWGDGTVGDVFDFVTNTMPESDPGSLTPEEYSSILAFFLRQSGYPTGEQELSTDKSELLKLRVVPLPK
jgi:hypothetical protein